MMLFKQNWIEVGVLFLFEGEKTKMYKGENTKWWLSAFDEAALLSVKDTQYIIFEEAQQVTKDINR